MLEINEENVLKDLKIIRSKLDSASMEECVETLQLLVKSMFFLKEKKSDSCPDKQWNEYCRIRYNLGRHFVDVIRLYNEKLTILINQKYCLLEDDLDDSSNILNSLSKNKQKDPEEFSEYNNKTKINSSNNLSVNSFNVDNSFSSNYPPSPIINVNYPSSPNPSINYPQHHLTYPNNINKTIQNNINDSVNRRSTLPANITNNATCSSPTNSYNNDNNDILPGNDNAGASLSYNDSDYQNSMSFASQSMMNTSNIQDDDEGDDFNDETDGIIGKYLCTKEFKAKEDFQIDLQLNDIVTINQFTGKYILGKNCRSNVEGLFPIFYIDSLDGNYVFFRCKEEMEFASVNDEIFLLRESDNEYCPGYNITKGEQGIFCVSKLEPISMNEEQRNKYEALYSDDANNIQPNRTMSSTTMDSTISENTSEIEDNNLAGPVLPANTKGQNDIILQIPKEFMGYANGNQIDQSIVEKLLDYYKTIPDLQDSDAFNKSKDSTDNNLNLMRDAIKKFQEFKSEDKGGMMASKDKSKADSFLSPSLFEDLETRNKKWEANRYRCQELVETEKSYCDKMRIMIDKFMKPLEMAVETENEMLNRVQISLIFKNIPDIYEFSRKLHEELAEAFTHYDEEGPIPIARVFLNKFSDWKLYIKYVEDFHSANTTLENLKKSPQTDRFNRFMEICQKSDECNRSHLKDLIVLPIQRFLKYRLLFEGIKKDSDPRKTESYNLLDTVENYIFEIGEIMNNAKRIQENINKMFSLEKTIMNYPPELISYTQRSFISEWNITEILKNKQKRLYLFSDTVLFATFLSKKKGKRYKYAYEKRIDILDYDITKSSSTASNRVIKFVETERNKSSKPNHRTYRNSSHTHSLLGFSLTNHSAADVSITKSLIFFETEDACNDFIKKYNEQKSILLKNADKEK